MAGLRPVTPPRVAETIRHLPPDIKRAVRSAIRMLSANPAAGAPLQRELKGLSKYRVRRYRIVYEVRQTEGVLRIIAVGLRTTIYEELAETATRK
jgi:mRNA interferase RelE/StbE